MNKSNWAKIFGYIAASAVALGQAGTLGKYSGLATSIGMMLAAFGIHSASNTGGNA